MAKNETGLKIADVEIPVATGTPNPFTEPIAELNEAWNDELGQSRGAKALKVPANEAKRHASRIGEAARALGRSARVRYSDNDGNPIKSATLNAQSEGEVVIRFWLKAAREGDNN